MPDIDDKINDAFSIFLKGAEMAHPCSIVGIVGLFSGGNDSTTLCHLFKDYVTHFAHANTGIGVEQTRVYVRNTCDSWKVPLIEYTPPKHSYEKLVLGQAQSVASWAKYPVIWPGGFPGPAHHNTFFGRLKEDTLNLIKKELVLHPHRERVIFLNGMRKEESARRQSKMKWNGEAYRQGSSITISPLANWTKLDLNAYRRARPDTPRNEVADILHMSGECLCGCYAKDGELDEISEWFPDTAEYIRELEGRVTRAVGDVVSPETLRWGWGRRGNCPTGLCNT